MTTQKLSYRAAVLSRAAGDGGGDGCSDGLGTTARAIA